MNKFQKEQVCLRIFSDDLDFDDIQRNIPLSARISKKGDIRYGITFEADVMTFEVDCDKEKLTDKISCVLNSLDPYKEYIKKIAKKYDVILRIYLESDMAQIYSYLPLEIITKMTEMSLALEVSIWSEGKVEASY